VPADARQGEPDRSDHDGYSFPPIDKRLVLWQWRVRVAGAAAPVAWLVMQDWSPVAIAVLGFGSGVAAMLLASGLARVELWVRCRGRARR